MKQSSVTLHVEEFRAISKAVIKLDGITVVAGVNGCGKSTLSKLLYTAFRLPINFVKGVMFKKKIETFSETYAEAEIHLIDSLNFKESSLKFKLLLSIIDDMHKTNQDKEIDFVTLSEQRLNKIKKSIQHDLIEDPLKQNKISRLINIYSENLVNGNNEISKYLNSIKNTSNWEDLVDFLLFSIKKMADIYYNEINNKPSKYFYDEIKNIFHINYLPKKLEIWEKEVPIVSTENENMMAPFEIDNVIYIDTPMAFNHYEEEHWKELNEKLKTHPKLNSQPQPIQKIDDLMKNQIFQNGAEVKFDDLSESFTLRLKNGVELNLSDGATGMKAFAILDRLVKNGSINEKTLLILDEPEAHLHPQWIVEFGRLLTLINKHIGAKVFVATHSPDMVQALRYIPNKEEIGQRVNFYLAEFNQENGLFDYIDLNGKVSKIFTSFNQSLSKLEKYGEQM